MDDRSAQGRAAAGLQPAAHLLRKGDRAGADLERCEQPRRHAAAFAADAGELSACEARISKCPLGSGSGYGIPLPLERAFGCFHSAGTLGTAVEPGAARNNQKGGELLIHLEDAFSYDGRTSVLGKITDKGALDSLKQLTQAGARTAKIVSATTL